MPEQERALGCRLEPPTSPSVEPMLGGAPLPEQFIVPAWRDCFGASFETLPAVLGPRILDQGQQDSCVGHGTSVQKSAQEGVLISPRDIFRLAKKYDGDPNGYGTSCGAAQDALVKDGAAEDSLVDRNPNVPRDQYRSVADVTPEVLASRAKHKGRSPYFVPRTLIRQTLIETGIPVVTSSGWYSQDNAIGMDGMMRLPTSGYIAGHCFAAIGWVTRAGKTCLVMVNSFGAGWGNSGVFYVPLDGTENRLGNAYVTLDVAPDLAAIVAKYEGKDVRSGVDHWRIQGGKRRRYPNEIVWWAHGRLFGIDVFDIDAGDLAIVPQGPDVTIEESQFKTRELVRQIRQHFGAN